MTEKLRFAPLIRVSTESQEKRGESLLSQETRIKDCVRYLDGVIPEYAWKYCGQEHSTPGYERNLFDQLIADSAKDLFDAIIVDDVSRWARDVVKSKTTLEILRKNNIKLFAGSMEVDLFRPDPMFTFDMQVQVAEHYAQTRSYKATINKIHKAKRGLPSSGMLPYGRTFDKKTETWGIDQEKKEIVKRAAKYYLNGDSFETVATKVGIVASRLINILKHRCGDSWEVHFNSPRFKIDEKITMKIPRLLPEATIKAIYERADSNRTWTHGPYTNKNLLSRFVFCAHCGATLSAQKKGRFKYYRHRYGSNCKGFISIRAEILENAVMVHLFNTFGDVKALEKAAKMAIPNMEEVKGLKAELAANEKELSKIKKAKNRLIAAIEEYGIDPDINEKMKTHRERQELLKAENRTLQFRIEEIPSEETITMKTKLLHSVLESSLKGIDHLAEMSFDDKRALIQTVFGGKDSEGNRFGIYLEKREDATKYDWMFTIKGNLINEIENLPMSKEAMRDLLDIPDPEFDPLKGYIVDSVSQD
jgi:site-specific DNA recombinase